MPNAKRIENEVEFVSVFNPIKSALKKAKMNKDQIDYVLFIGCNPFQSLGIPNARDTLKDIRKIIYDLMPMSLDDLGLVPTIKKLISNILDNSNINIEFDVVQNTVIDNTLTNLMVFRVIQEAFNNIVKHAQCKNAYIRLVITDHEIQLEIRDDGKGFDLGKTMEKPSGYGLYNMHERIEIVNGTLDIQSEKNKGTIIRIKIPNN